MAETDKNFMGINARVEVSDFALVMRQLRANGETSMTNSWVTRQGFKMLAEMLVMSGMAKPIRDLEEARDIIIRCGGKDPITSGTRGAMKLAQALSKEDIQSLSERSSYVEPERDVDDSDLLDEMKGMAEKAAKEIDFGEIPEELKGLKGEDDE